MAHSFETEIKLVATATMLESLRTNPNLRGDDRPVRLVSTYFDTGDGSLWRAGAALRIREECGRRQQTLKLASPQGAMVRRYEWNAPAPGEIPDLSQFPGKARSAIAQLLNGAPVVAAARTQVERTARSLQFGRSLIEVAFDIGTIDGRGRRENVSELELELVQGNLADLIALVLKLPLGPELNWSITSKAQRCYALAGNVPFGAVHAKPVKLAPMMDVAHGFQAIAWNCLEQLLANYRLVISSGHAEAVHQTRVAIRRLRAASSLFADIAEDDSKPLLRAELKAVALSLGPARDLQVLFERVAGEARNGDHDLNDLCDCLASQRDRALASAQQLLAGASFQRLLFEFAAWLEGGNWLRRKEATGGDRPLVPFAASVLARRRRKLRRRPGRMVHLPPPDLHALRIDTKKFRYATEFFASLFNRKAQTRDQALCANALKRLQDSLGELNDMAVATARQDKMFTDLDAITAAKYQAQLRELLAAHAKSRRKFFKIAQKSLTKVIDARAWWNFD